MADEVFFSMRDIDKDYFLAGEAVHVLKKITLSIEEGEYLSVLGPSGSGKSTLMNIIGCLDTPTAGQYILHGREVEDMDEEMPDIPEIPASLPPKSPEAVPNLASYGLW